MGTAVAVKCAYLYIDYLEMTTLFTDLSDLILFYKRYIDDGIIIWKASDNNSDAIFEEFMRRLNSYGVLKWTTTGFVNKIEFMDVTVSIDKSYNLQFKTFQKEQNLYLYIPPLSAHSNNMI